MRRITSQAARTQPMQPHPTGFAGSQPVRTLHENDDTEPIQMKSLIAYPNHLVLDQQSDWPESLKVLLAEQEQEVTVYLNEERRIDKLA